MLLLVAATAAIFVWYMQQQADAAPIGAGVSVEPMGSPAWSGSTSFPDASSSQAWSASPSDNMFLMDSPTQGASAPAILAPMRVSPDGRAFIQQQEGLALRPYADAGLYSIGYGHQLRQGESYPNGISQEQANALFNDDVAAVEQTLNAAVTVELTQPQFDALASFVYNIGAPRFLTSTLLRQLNAGDYAGAAAQFPAWNKSQGRVNSVLVARRADEQGLFESAFA